MGDGADVFKGQYVKDKRCGYGTFTWGLTGASYRGEFKEDTMNGYGIYSWNDGSMFEGNFVDGKPYGKGKITEYKTG